MQVQVRGDKHQAALIAFATMVILCAIALITVDHLTRERAAANARAAQLRLITAVMPLPHDNDLLNDRQEISDEAYFITGARVGVYRARMAGQPVGLVFMPIPAKGYGGLMELAVGIAYNGELTGVRVQAHRETPGLGDQIDQDRGPWIFGFDRRSLRNTPPEAWGVAGDGGDFDQISGATISPRGVIKAVKNTLDYYAVYKDELYK
jgi:electron transport complex protein RnfG